MFTNVSLWCATSSEYRATKVRKNYVCGSIFTEIIRWLADRKLGDLTGSDRHTEEESIRVEKEALYLEISKLSQLRSLKLDEDRQEQMMENRWEKWRVLSGEYEP